MRGATIAECVALVFRDGSLYGARPGRASRTLTVEGRRVVRIRLQADICGALYRDSMPEPYYPELRAAIIAAIDAGRASVAS